MNNSKSYDETQYTKWNKNNDIKEIKISKSNHSIVIIKNGVTVKEQFAIDDEILDYITNLQEENDRLNKVIISNHKELESLYNHLTKKDLDYISRIDIENILNGGDE